MMFSVNDADCVVSVISENVCVSVLMLEGSTFDYMCMLLLTCCGSIIVLRVHTALVVQLCL